MLLTFITRCPSYIYFADLKGALNRFPSDLLIDMISFGLPKTRFVGGLTVFGDIEMCSP